MTTTPNLLWSSTGGGWRAMFADIGYANLFAQANLFSPTQSAFKSISTVSGGSWFSTQLFYSEEFYNRTVLASSPEEIYEFVLQWMDSYYEISTDISNTTMQQCNFTELYDEDNERMVDTITEMCYLLDTFDYDWATFMRDMLGGAASGYGSPGFVDILASVENIVEPLKDTDLIVLAALAPASRVRSESGDDMAVYLGSKVGGENEDVAQLWTVALPAAWIVDTSSNVGEFFLGVNNIVSDVLDASSDAINVYDGVTPKNHSWDDWSSFYLFTGKGTTDGRQYTNNTSINAQSRGSLRPLFGGTTPTTLQVAAISSAAAASASPLGPVTYTQNLSIGYHAVFVNTVKTVWRVLAGIAAGIGVGLVLGVAIAQLRYRYDVCKYCSTRRENLGNVENDNGDNDNTDDVTGEKDEVENNAEQDDVKQSDVHNENTEEKVDNTASNPTEIMNDPEASSIDNTAKVDNTTSVRADKVNEPQASNDDIEYNNCCCCTCEHPARSWGIGCGIFLGIIAGVLTATFYGLGSIIVPSVYDNSVDQIYQNPMFDNFAVCSQWPNLPCQEDDAYMMDGWFVDNPAVPINIGHMQQKIGLNGTLKVIITNCNDVWDTEWNRAQFLSYYSTYFNQGVPPGGYSWGPGWFVPSRSQQIFSEYLDAAGLDALLNPITDSNMTTALLQGTTVNNPAYNVRAGQRVEMLLLNANANITTYVIGKTNIEKYTQPLADMASHIAGSQELLLRVKEFVME